MSVDNHHNWLLTLIAALQLIQSHSGIGTTMDPHSLRLVGAIIANGRTGTDNREQGQQVRMQCAVDCRLQSVLLFRDAVQGGKGGALMTVNVPCMCPRQRQSLGYHYKDAISAVRLAMLTMG